ncbi:MAG: hypothetical protein R3343_10705 [Nitriliruptorales bacterium]|nr:hypothetical protein [Nitriliruptorales bacterium]
MTGVSWRDFAAAAPELAAAVRRRFEANLHHVLGTIRPDGAPRLSGTEVTIGEDELTVGMMPDSHKLADVRRDPRVEVHSAPLEEDLATGDAKLSGRLVPIDPPGTSAAPPGSYFRLSIERVSLVTVRGNELVFTIWNTEEGLREVRRG